MSSLRSIHRSLIHRAFPCSLKPQPLRLRINLPSAARQPWAPAFSTGAVSLQKPARAPNADRKSTQTSNPELPKITLEGLGISKNVRIVLIVFLSIWGTFETYFYYQAVMRWWRARNQPENKTVDRGEGL
ncbi:hypothetical protein BJX68DRAFT_231071 [Aspergillus pseudodeflectus]|uniref:Uncharacterized protein n=1 Tax=Aspergillus pseudodeflectus TaxID=176178 RepID=A0ABR4KTU9_9EURO